MKYKLQDLIDMEQFQHLQDRLNEIYAFPSAIVDNEGNVLTATAWQDVCTQFHRKHPDCERECRLSDQYILSHLHEANPAVSYRCPHGLVDNATPIIIDGVHYANFFTGQFFLEKPDLEFFRAQAGKYGFDEEAYLKAVAKVPVWTQAQLNSYLFFIKGLIAVISESGTEKLKETEARKQIEESEERHRTILRTAIDGFWMVDLQGRLLEVNEAYCRMSGYNEQELLAMRIADLEAAETPADTAAHVRNISAQGEDRFESRHRRKDGRILDVEISVQYKAIQDGRQVAFIRDITERKLAEAALRKSEEKYRGIFDESVTTIYVFDNHKNFRDTNQAGLDLLGYSREELLRLSIPDVDADPVVVLPAHQELLSGGRLVNYEHKLRRKDGSIVSVLNNSRPLTDADGKAVGMLSTLIDITEQRELEQRLRQAQKMESVGQLAGGVAHDFNNIVAAIMMQLSFLRGNPNLGAEAQDLLKEVLTEAKRAANLTRQLLIFSRRSVLEIKVLDLNEVVANLLKMLSRLLGEHITVRFDPHPALPAVAADAGMIEQVLMNLAVNARDAMPHGGCITIGLEPIQVDGDRVQAHLEALPGLFVRVSVADTGCGMDEATLKRVFEPFFTTKEPGKGTGLGLATVYGIAAQHKGWVEVASELGKGTTFGVFLPATTEGIVEPTPPGQLGTLRGHETILLVEDEAILRRMVTQVLRGLGYRVREAGNGREAITLWQEHAGQIDLLISDMVMPEGMTGLDLAEKLRVEKPGLKVIISSGYNVEMAGARRPTAGGITYLQKPYDAEGLSKTIRDCLERS